MKAFVDRLRRWFKFRFAVLYPVGIYLAIFCNIDERSFFLGSLVVVLGVLTRIWANCYAIKMDRLTTSGPYAFVRNPLYLGTALIMLGVVILLRIYLLGLVFITIVGFVYYRTIISEQRMLTDKFGDDYLDYMRKVPVIFPRLAPPYAKGEKWPWSWKRLWESREHKVVIWIGIAIIAFYLKGKFLMEREALNIRTVLLISGVGMLVAMDVIADVLRGKLKKDSI